VALFFFFVALLFLLVTFVSVGFVAAAVGP
jgi:hypothetical protein